MSCFFSRWW